jgi:hypothetical protein
MEEELEVRTCALGIWIGGSEDDSESDARMLKPRSDDSPGVVEGKLIWNPKKKMYDDFNIEIVNGKIQIHTSEAEFGSTPISERSVNRVFVVDLGYWAECFIGGSITAAKQFYEDMYEEIGEDDESYKNSFNEELTEVKFQRIWDPSQNKYRDFEIKETSTKLKILMI